MNSSKFGKSVKGFTIIEFLVASILAMIVIMAAGSTYFMTRKLGDTAQKRLNIQQNLRNATAQISRDARMAGSFGCYNTSSTLSGRKAPIFNGIAAPLVLDDTADGNYGIKKAVLPLSGGSYEGLVFIYGLTDTGVTEVTTTSGKLSNVDNNILSSIKLAQNVNKEIDPLRQTLAQKGDIVISSCREAHGLKLPSAINGDTIPLNLDTTFRDADIGELTVTQLYAAAYILNKNTKQLMRLDTQPNGNWGAPQVVSNGINSMDVGFGYADDCPLQSVSTASGPAEKFSFTKNMATGSDKKQLPAIVQIRLNYDANTDGTAGTADYVINATVRGGNTCGNRTPI